MPQDELTGDYDQYLFQQRSDQAKQPAGVVPSDGWSGNGTFSVPPITDGIKRATGEIVLQIAFPKPGYYTVQFNIAQLSPLVTDSILNPLVVRPQAEIIWTVKGTPIRRLIDINDGSSISGTGEKVYVRLTDNSFFNGLTDVEYTYTASITIAPGLRPIQGGVQPPIKTAVAGYYGVDASAPFDASGLFAINSAATPPLFDNRTNVFIPQNCGINSYYLSIANVNPALAAPAAGDFQIIQDGGSPGIQQTLSLVNYDGVGKWVPLMPGAKIITIRNSYAVVDPSTTFGTILFGVEG